MRVPRVSVIIPTYERRGSVGAAVESALQQTFSDLEVVVVDDGSTDGTADYLEQAFTDPRLNVHRKENGGTATARNHGLHAARGEFVAFLDSDDLYLPEFVAAQLASLDANSASAASVTDARYEGGWKHTWDTVFARCVPPQGIAEMLQGRWALAGAMMVRTAVARQLRFDPQVHMEDTDFLFRFFAAGYRLSVVSQPLVVYRRAQEAAGASQKSDQRDRIRLEFIRLLEAYAEHAPDEREHRLRLHRRWSKYLLGVHRGKEAREHIWAWWRARPTELKAGWYLLRSFGQRPQ